ncbi:hypothetical protein QR685DRAFT_568583 [Neurospora intermedia]|uniref:Questionable protein n=1 Tax=Neurospora intermedia TaxID=5142 RepID=A0ABR3DT90_NEUIN
MTYSIAYEHPITCCTARIYRAKEESKSRQPPSSEDLFGLGWANWANHGMHEKALGGAAYQTVSSSCSLEVLGSTRCHWPEGLVVARHHLDEAGLSQLPSEGSRCTTSADGYALVSMSTAVRESNDIAHHLTSTSPSSPPHLNKAQPTARRPPRPLVREVVRAHTHTHTIRGHPHPAVYCKVPLSHLFACVRHTRRVPDISIAQGCQLISECVNKGAKDTSTASSRHRDAENDRRSSCGLGWDMAI